ncbi:uncharacterized protein ARMOST_21244 [Armillaria ostoyae]|uniref:Uncharacterized protein n=1 Tax=Armillaria ostoyae TaxID=47428 RepID=A0A284S9J7_ARMOS|nr:uncharacterized protein ARMOST_21244 [Armillaria ostoyae]
MFQSSFIAHNYQIIFVESNYGPSCSEFSEIRHSPSPTLLAYTWALRKIGVASMMNLAILILRIPRPLENSFCVGIERISPTLLAFDHSDASCCGQIISCNLALFMPPCSPPKRDIPVLLANPFDRLRTVPFCRKQSA